MEKQTTKKKKKDLKITAPLKRQEGQNKNHENLRKDFERETEGERSLEMDEMLTIQVRVAPGLPLHGPTPFAIQGPQAC